MSTTTNQTTTDPDTVDPDTRAQIRERLTWTPAGRLAYLKDMIVFEQRAQTARRLL
jgi:hypothetical protein